MRPLDQWCALALERPASRPAIEFAGHWYNWGELRQLGDALGALLDASGADPHATIAFVPRNHPAAIATLLALIARRRHVRMIYAFQSPAAIARDIERCAPQVLIAASDDCGEPVQTLLRNNGIAGIALDGLQPIAITGTERARHGSASLTPTAPRLDVLTSGTTGPPKPFAVSHEMIARHYLASGPEDLCTEPPTLLFFPLANITGIYATLPPLLKGQRAVLLERFTVAGWHDHLLRYRPSAGGLPPVGLQMVLDAEIPPADLACLRRLGTGAAALDPTVHRRFEQHYGVPVLLSYGATEFGGPVTAMTLELHAEWGARKFGSVGRALPGVQLRVVDPQTGTPLPASNEGLLEVISPRIGPEWIRTSDLALIDEDGFVFHRGRIDGAITRGGFKVLPDSIDRVLMLHPAVSAAATIGIADARLGEVPATAVQLKTRCAAPTFAELETHLREHLPATHVPVRWRYVDALPRTPSLKVERSGLRQLFSITS